MRRITLYGAGILLFGIDRLLKIFSRNFSADHQVFGDVLVFTHVENSGIAWGIPFSGTWALIASSIALIIVMALLAASFQKKQILIEAGWMLIWLGAFSNFLDRILDGVVTDFLQPLAGPAMNIADIMIAVGAAIAIGGYLAHSRRQLKA
ncbi:MAG TPA: hypothetical protein DHV25_04430 [Candidatus Kerfeldbacteria bacterium]|nr:MAG: Lipoprotein signal peptidase [Parcubacteria group bacterium GW2011_GWA2_48_9]KKW15957.1 MAG: Lipoprotein signal peptidase [Parcubacteria group bacterium GW2011_GWC2_49_9]HCJ52935.1 hypothetical protein [Candidatus Kerfeldbacteria bacterium]